MSIRFQEIEYPDTLSPDANDLLKKLLVKTPTNRLGSGEDGVLEIMMHPWFNDIDFNMIYHR
jgi:serine/threonine protein kinase